MKGTRFAGHQTGDDWCPFCFGLIRTRGIKRETDNLIRKDPLSEVLRKLNEK